MPSFTKNRLFSVLHCPEGPLERIPCFSHRAFDQFDLLRRTHRESVRLRHARWHPVEGAERPPFEALLRMEAQFITVKHQLQDIIAEELNVGDEWPQALCQMVRWNAMVRDRTMPEIHRDCGQVAPHFWHRYLARTWDGPWVRPTQGQDEGSSDSLEDDYGGSDEDFQCTDSSLKVGTGSASPVIAPSQNEDLLVSVSQSSSDVAQDTPSSSTTGYNIRSLSLDSIQREVGSQDSVVNEEEEEKEEDQGVDESGDVPLSEGSESPVSHSDAYSEPTYSEDDPYEYYVEYAGHWLFDNDSTPRSSQSAASPQPTPSSADHTWIYPQSYDQGIRMNFDEEPFLAVEDMFNDPNLPLSESERRFYQNLLSE